MLLAALLPAPAGATAAAGKCGPLKQVNTIQMQRAGALDLVPITVADSDKKFVLDTGNYLTAIRRQEALDLRLPIQQSAYNMVDLTGAMSREETTVPRFALGLLHGNNISFMIASNDQALADVGADGAYGLDNIGAYDADMDFGSDKLTFFAPDHCPGAVVYWKAATVGVVPMTTDHAQIVVTVTLDGHELKAIVDTSAQHTMLRLDEARSLYRLKMDTPDTPQGPPLVGDATVKTWLHTFKSLTFGDIAVGNPHLQIIPDVAGRAQARAPQAVGHAASDQTMYSAPQMIIGMDLLRRLHVYMAFKGQRMYVSPASAP